MRNYWNSNVNNIVSSTDKMGILVALAVTATAVAFVANASTVNESSMQLQGELAIARTAAELREIPENTEEFIDESIETIEESIEEIDNVVDAAETITEEVEEVIEKTTEEEVSVDEISTDVEFEEIDEDLDDIL